MRRNNAVSGGSIDSGFTGWLSPESTMSPNCYDGGFEPTPFSVDLETIEPRIRQVELALEHLKSVNNELHDDSMANADSDTGESLIRNKNK